MLSFGQFESQARQLLARASILAEAKASPMDPNGPSHDKHPGGRPPSGDTHDTFSWLLARFERCSSLRDFEEFCEVARAEIDNVCKAKPGVVVKLETEAQLFARIVNEGEGFDVKVVAASLRTTDKIVVRARKDARRDLSTGKPAKGKQPLSAAERRLRARELRKQGWKLHEIAYELKCDEATASRDINKAA